MQLMQSAPTFVGTDEEQQLASQIFSLARSQGRFFTARAAIALKRDELVGFVASQRKDLGDDRAAIGDLIDAAMAANATIFARRETDDGVVSYVTTRNGVVYFPAPEDLDHSLAQRFMTVVAALPPPPPPPKRAAPLIADGWSQRPNFADLAPESSLEEGFGAEAVPTDEVLATAPIAEDTVVEIAPVAEVAPEAQPEPIAVAPTMPTPAEVPVEELRAALLTALEADARFVSFGDRYFSEDLVDRYSRGDLRRIREYIVEVGEPVGDDQLLQEVFNRRPNDPTYEPARFSINYRLSREKREFEFVGTGGARLWSTPGLAPIGTTIRKASELGTDYRYLLEEATDAATGDSVSHTLSFFEWANGLLPLDGELGRLFPAPYLDDQKTAMIRFQVPQLYVTFLTEARYPTGNRGGYLVGFDEFYRENLLPGTVFTIERVPSNDGEYVIRYVSVSPHEVRTLQIDERRNRYVFRPQTVQMQTAELWLLTENRYPRLGNIKPLDDRERRRTDGVVGLAFERVAENVGTKSEPRYWSAPEELLPIVNIDRPFSMRALQEVLESPQYPQFSADPETPGAFFYVPPAKAKETAGKRRAARSQEEEVAEEVEEEVAEEVAEEDAEER